MKENQRTGKRTMKTTKKVVGKTTKGNYNKVSKDKALYYENITKPLTFV